jgi:hypothetical protein
MTAGVISPRNRESQGVDQSGGDERRRQGACLLYIFICHFHAYGVVQGLKMPEALFVFFVIYEEMAEMR